VGAVVAAGVSIAEKKYHSSLHLASNDWQGRAALYAAGCALAYIIAAFLTRRLTRAELKGKRTEGLAPVLSRIMLLAFIFTAPFAYAHMQKPHSSSLRQIIDAKQEDKAPEAGYKDKDRHALDALIEKESTQ
jgi:hypothetical protein